MATTQEIYEVTYSSPEITNLGDYLMSQDSPAFPSHPKPEWLKKGTNEVDWEVYAKAFCEYTNGTISNYQRIINSIRKTPQKNQVIAKQINYVDFPLRPSIKFSIPRENVDRIGLLTQGIEVASNDAGAFKAQALLELENDIKYYPILKSVEKGDDVSVGNLKKMYPNMTVWIWCRALSNDVKDGDLEGSFFDITPFCDNLTTSASKNGGNFQIGLGPILAEQDATDGRWSIKAQTLTISDDKQQFLASSSTDKLVTVNGKTASVRSSFMLHNCITTNDLVFIRFETLSLEQEQRAQDFAKGAFYIDKNDIAGRIYDMIGLVDKNSISVDHENRDVTIRVEGRDLSKLFIDDGTYFYALENKQGTLNFAGGSTAQNDLTRRLIYDNSIPYLGLYFNNSIENVLKFVIQQLSTIEVVPQDLFSSYGMVQASVYDLPGGQYLPKEILDKIPERRNTRFQLTNQEKTDQATYNKQIAAQKATAKQLITSLRKANGANIFEGKATTSVAEPLFATNIYSALHSFISDQYDANNLIIVGSQVTGWKTLTQLDASKNPISTTPESTFPINFLDYETQLFPSNSTLSRSEDTGGVVNAIYNIVSQEKKRATYSPKEELGLANGIWQIVKLVIDKQVANRRIVDASISSANGSLLNFIRKICQEPFVEFLMDTYKDQYYLIVRKPPHDKQAMIDMITGGCYSEGKSIDQQIDDQDDYYAKGQARNAIIDIEAVDVIQENFLFDDAEVYSWYHFTPQGNFFGNADDFSLSYIPALNFPEYADIWGSKPLDIVNNYLPYLPLDKKNTGIDYFSKQAFYDLKFLVDSHQYLPFTRKGTIMVNRDRRIKVGNPIRFKPTGEIFWVDSVSHSHANNNGSLDATTTIQVSRGMIEAFIYGITGKDVGDQLNPEKVYSYFSIINTQLDFSHQKAIPRYKTVTVQQTVIKDAFGNVITNKPATSTVAPAPVDPLSPFTGIGQPEMYMSPIIVAWAPSDKLYNSLKAAEGFIPSPKYDINGYAIGYGSHYYANGSAVQAGDAAISEPVASALLKATVLNRYFPTVKKQFPSLNFTQNELDALCSTAYNHGSIPGGSGDNNLVKAIYKFKRGTITGAQLKAVWVTAAITVKGSPIPLQTLINRRTEEADWFLTGHSPTQSSAVETVEVVETTKQVPTGEFDYVPDETQVLNNFKVDKQIFNFFLRKQHFDYHAAGYGQNKLDTVTIKGSNAAAVTSFSGIFNTTV